MFAYSVGVTNSLCSSKRTEIHRGSNITSATCADQFHNVCRNRSSLLMCCTSVSERINGILYSSSTRGLFGERSTTIFAVPSALTITSWHTTPLKVSRSISHLIPAPHPVDGEAVSQSQADAYHHQNHSAPPNYQGGRAVLTKSKVGCKMGI